MSNSLFAFGSSVDAAAVDRGCPSDSDVDDVAVLASELVDEARSDRRQGLALARFACGIRVPFWVTCGSAVCVAVDDEEVDEVDFDEELDPLRGRSGAGPMLRADLRKSLLTLELKAFMDFTGEPSLVGAGGGFSGDFCLGGVFCLIDGVLVDDRLLAALLFGLADFDRLISLTRAAKVEISFFSGTSLRVEHTLGSRLWLGLSRL